MINIIVLSSQIISRGGGEGGGAPMPLRQEAPTGPSMGPTLWCAICQVARKHVTDNCHLLQNFVQNHNNCSVIFANRWATMSATTIAMN